MLRKLARQPPLAAIDDPLTAMQFRAFDWIVRNEARHRAETRATCSDCRKRSDREIFERFPLHFVPTYPGDDALMRSALFRAPAPAAAVGRARSSRDIIRAVTRRWRQRSSSAACSGGSFCAGPCSTCRSGSSRSSWPPGRSFFLLWGPGRRGVMRNLDVDQAGIDGASANFFRTLPRLLELRLDDRRQRPLQGAARRCPTGSSPAPSTSRTLQSREGGAIILTAHMGSYDLGAHLFAEIVARGDRDGARAGDRSGDAPVRGGAARAHGADALKIDFSTRASELALDLLHALQRGEIIAIQGDRVTPGISTLPATLFGKAHAVPAGPFALAMAARVPIYPLFIVRARTAPLSARRRQAVRSARARRDRDESFERGAWRTGRTSWRAVVRMAWFQWFAFQPYAEEAAA